MSIDWQTAESVVLCNPRLPDADRSGLLTELLNAPVAPGHVWLATSGSSGQIKWGRPIQTGPLGIRPRRKCLFRQSLQRCMVQPPAALSRRRPRHLGPQPPERRSSGGFLWATTRDVGCPALSCLSPSTSGDSEFSVPAQVYDLVHLNLCPPASLRAIIVGGGALSESLLNKGRELGWKLHPSYGLTECASQVATWRQDGLEILNHVEIRISKKGCIEIHSPALLSLYALTTSQGMQYIDPKVAGWFTTEDQGSVTRPALADFGPSGQLHKNWRRKRRSVPSRTDFGRGPNRKKCTLRSRLGSFSGCALRVCDPFSCGRPNP